MLSRRTLLKGLTSFSLIQSAGRLSFGLTANPANSIPAPQLTLNVILHGLFVMHFLDDHIELLTPFVDEHTYAAGNWTFSDVRQNALDPRNGPFSLLGVDPQPRFDPSTLSCPNLLSKQKHHFQVDASKAYITITLPFPQEIRLLRCVKADKIFSGFPMDDVKEMSVCQVLRYPVSTDPRNLTFTGVEWFPQVKPDTKTANLHLWAEPEEDMLEDHRVKAYVKLMDIIHPLNFSLVVDDPAPLDDPPPVPGVTKEEEMGLSEWFHAGEGVHGSDCDCLMVVA